VINAYKLFLSLTTGLEWGGEGVGGRGFVGLAGLYVAALVLLSVLLQSYAPLHSYSYSLALAPPDPSCAPTPLAEMLSNVTILNFVNVTSVRPLRFDVHSVGLRVGDLIANLTSGGCCSAAPAYNVSLSVSVVYNETRGRFGTLFLEVTATVYNETWSSTSVAYILAHKANVTHGLVGVLAILKPRQGGGEYELVNIIADYKPLEDEPTRLADIVYLNTTTLNTELKLSDTFRVLAQTLDRISNNYEATTNNTLKLQAKAYKAIATQLRTIASTIQSKLKDYNWKVATATIIALDQEEELFINWCDICKIVIWAVCTFITGGGGYVLCYDLCKWLFVKPWLLAACIAICTIVVPIAALLCIYGAPAEQICKDLGFC